MEIVDVIALAHFEDSRVGGVTRKQRFRLAAPLADQLAEMGLVQRVVPFDPSTAPPLPSPTTDAGAVESSPSSPPAPRSPEPTATSSPEPKSSAAGASSSSTTHTASSLPRTPSTPATEHGGTSKSKKPAPSKASVGPKTAKRQTSTD